MTKFCQLVAALSLALIGVSSCGQAAPPDAPPAAPPAKQLTPIQVQVIAEKQDSQTPTILLYGTNFYVASNGIISQPVPVKNVVNLNGPAPPDPTPTPTPTPTPLNARQQKYHALVSAVSDPSRAAKTKKLADAYWSIAANTAATIPEMQLTIWQTDNAIITSDSAAAWQVFRDTLSNDWADLQRLPDPLPPANPTDRFRSFLADVSAGLSASLP